MNSTAAACGGDTGSCRGERQQLPGTRKAGRDSPKSSCTTGVVTDSFCGPSLRLRRHAPVFKARRHSNASLSDDSDSSDIRPDYRETDDSSACCGFSTSQRRTSIPSGGTSITHGHSVTSTTGGHSYTSIPRVDTYTDRGGTTYRRLFKPLGGTSISQTSGTVTPQSDASSKKSTKRGHERKKQVTIQPQQQHHQQEIPELSEEDDEPIDYMEVYHRLRMGRLGYPYGYGSGRSFRAASTSRHKLPPPPPSSIPISSNFAKAFAVSPAVESTWGPRRHRFRGTSAVTAPSSARSAPIPQVGGALSPIDNLVCLLRLLGNQDDDWTLASGGGSGRSRGNKDSTRNNGGASRGTSRHLRQSGDQEVRGVFIECACKASR